MKFPFAVPIPSLTLALKPPPAKFSARFTVRGVKGVLRGMMTVAWPVASMFPLKVKVPPIVLSMPLKDPTLPKVTVWAGVGTPEAGSICVRGTGTRGTHVRGVTAGTALVALPTADVQSVTITRGRDSDTESAAPGTCTVTFDNTSGDYDHTYTAGPWFGRLNLGVT